MRWRADRQLDLATVKPAQIRAITEERVDPVLFHMSRDFVGDLAETVALLWPKQSTSRRRSTTAPCGSAPSWSG
jgi:hypothetical protein